MVYFDTSFLVPMIRPEAASAKVVAFFKEIPPDELATSQWARLEFASFIARELRMGVLKPDTATQALGGFQTMLDQSFTVFLPDVTDFDLAARYLTKFATGLRAGDAL